MKKILPIVLIGILVLSGLGAGAVSNIVNPVIIEKSTDEHILEISIDIPSIEKFQIMSYPSGQRVEMEGYGQDNPTFIQKILGVAKKPRLTLIGPANLLKTVHKDRNMIQTKIISGRGAK